MSSGRHQRFALTLALVLALPGAARARVGSPRSFVPETIRLHLASWHDRGGYDNTNLGLALRWNGGPVAGGFKNSFGRPSWYGGLLVQAFEKRAFQLELMAGVISGYSDASPVDVVAVPSLGWRLSPRSTLQVVFMPRLVIPANAVHVMLEQRLGAIEPPGRRGS